MHELLGVFRSFSLLSVRLLSLLNLNFRAGYTFNSRMCRGIVGDEKVFQLFPLKCGTGLMFSEKNVVFIVQSGVKLYDRG